MTVSESQKRATAKYEKENYDKILVRFPKGTKNRIKDTGADSVNSYIINCVLNALDGFQSANVAAKTEETIKQEKKTVDLAELQKLLDQKRADVIQEKRIKNGEFMTVSREEDSLCNKS